MISRGVIRNAASQLNHRLSRIRSESSSLRSQSGAGAELFRKAKEIVYEKIPKLVKEKDERDLREQISAVEKKDASVERKSSRSAGVAVIKTIVKQTREKLTKDRSTGDKSQIEVSNESIEDSINRLQLEADQLLNEAALKHDHPEALVSLANQYLLEKEDVETAMKYYDQAASNGSGEAWFNLGHLYWTGYESDESSDNTFELKEDEIKAIECFKNAINCDDVDALYFIGTHLIQEDGDFLNKTKNAFKLSFPNAFVNEGNNGKERRLNGLMMIEQAAMLRHAEALYYLALLHRNGDSHLDVESFEKLKDESRYYFYLEEACNQGSANALFLRGNCFFHEEDGYDKDVQSALNDFLEASALGHADATVSAGAVYHKGYTPVKRDERVAFELYQKGAEMGSIEGWRNISACYLLGEGVPKCEKTAKHIYETMVQKADLAEEAQFKQ